MDPGVGLNRLLEAKCACCNRTDFRDWLSWSRDDIRHSDDRDLRQRNSNRDRHRQLNLLCREDFQLDDGCRTDVNSVAEREILKWPVLRRRPG